MKGSKKSPQDEPSKSHFYSSWETRPPLARYFETVKIKNLSGARFFNTGVMAFFECSSCFRYQKRPRHYSASYGRNFPAHRSIEKWALSGECFLPGNISSTSAARIPLTCKRLPISMIKEKKCKNMWMWERRESGDFYRQIVLCSFCGQFASSARRRVVNSWKTLKQCIFPLANISHFRNFDRKSFPYEFFW